MRLIRQIIRRLTTPQPKIMIANDVWARLHRDLRHRADGVRESGAFLLGKITDKGRFVKDYILYDDLDPNCLRQGAIDFSGKHFGTLWNICRSRNMQVVADIHVHPGSEQQSSIDAAHPMISEKGHIAFIVPDFASQEPDVLRTGINQYLGLGAWRRIDRSRRVSVLEIIKERKINEQ